MYEEIVVDENRPAVIKYTAADGQIWWIPTDESNAMYQEYLIWKQENN